MIEIFSFFCFGWVVGLKINCSFYLFDLRMILHSYFDSLQVLSVLTFSILTNCYFLTIEPIVRHFSLFTATFGYFMVYLQPFTFNSLTNCIAYSTQGKISRNQVAYFVSGASILMRSAKCKWTLEWKLRGPKVRERMEKALVEQNWISQQ